MEFPEHFFEDEVREGFYVSGMIKRSWGATIQVLEEIKKVCERHNISWSVSFGTMLGAVRHKGFIPWDDDMDIIMLREDYEKFCSVAEQELPIGYVLKTPMNGHNNNISLVLNTVNMFEPESVNRCQYPYLAGVDIEVFDVVPDDPDLEEKWLATGRLILSLIACMREEPKDDNTRSVPDNHEQMTLTEVKAWLQNSVADRATVSLDNDFGNGVELDKEQGSSTVWAQSVLDYCVAIENTISRKFDPDIPLIRQTYVFFNQVAQTYHKGEGSRRAIFWGCQRPKRWFNIFPEQLLTDIIQLPFENTMVNCVRDYDTFLQHVYGDYHQIRRGALHDYPMYKKYEKEYLQGASEEIQRAFVYQPRQEDLIERDPNQETPKKIVAKLLNISDELLKLMFQAAQIEEIDQLPEILTGLQQNAIRIGETLEQTRGEGFAPVKELEVLCETIYEAYSNISNIATLDDLVLFLKPIQQQNSIAESQIREKYLKRKEILFLPVHAAHWKSLEPYWKEAMNDPQADVYVMPLNYYYKDYLGNPMGDAINEAADFPDEVYVITQESYDIAKRHPDIIVINSPYDQYNRVTTVEYDKYSTVLYQCTDRLIYIPWFTLDEILPNDGYAMQTTEYFISVPGVVRAEKVLLSSEAMRERYIEVLTGMGGEETRSFWEKKIILEL